MHSKESTNAVMRYEFGLFESSPAPQNYLNFAPRTRTSDVEEPVRQSISPRYRIVSDGRTLKVLAA